MDRAKTFSRSQRNSNKRKDFHDKEYYRKKIIIKSNAKVKVFEGYINIKVDFQEYNISFKKIFAIYISYNVDISFHDIFILANHFKLYIIDANGYIKGRVIIYEKK